MKHLGDITKIKGSEAPTVDCITGGSPCQDLSIAGKRAGLAGERSGLFMEQIRLIKEMREHDKSAGRMDDDIRPRWMVWENVPGAFSSNGGEDFRAVLEETARVKEPDAVIPRPADGKWTPAGCIMGDGWAESETMYTLNSTERHAVASYGFDPQRKAEGMGFTEETAASLVNGTNPGHHIGVLTFTRERSDKFSAGEIISTIGARDYKGATDLIRDCGVRRLTPTECERLQGYPDGWTDIGEWTDSKGKKHKGDADAPRYKALGNSIALPFWFWLLRRISATYCRPATLGSLFDGIGGFPLCWERCNGAGTAIWASEIEEFPIAVTKRHFAEEKQK